MHRTGNHLLRPDFCALHKTNPWKAARPADYLVETSRLEEQDVGRILGCLEKHGICQLRIAAMEPGHSRLGSLAQGIGPACTQQNDFHGTIKEIKPKEGVAANTGDSAGELGFHVDGTQHERTPAVLVFQYELNPRHGGYSTFIDMSYVLGQFPEAKLETIVRRLSRSDAAYFAKKGMTFAGPLLQHVHGGRAVACRLRFDGEGGRVCQVNPECAEAFEELRAAIAAQDEVIEIKPQNGDIILFDNWRVLHGRRAVEVSKLHGRLHDRMWIRDLKSQIMPDYVLGVRLGPELMADVMRANAMSATWAPPA